MRISARLITVAVLGGSLAAAAGSSSLAAGRSGAGHRRHGWSAPRPIDAPDAYASVPQVAVGGSGRFVVAWNGGTPPDLVAGVSAAPDARSGAAMGLDVEAVLGGLRGRIGDVAVLSAANATAVSPPAVAVSGAGVAYAAWSQGTRDVWMVAAARGRRFGRPRRLGIPAGAALQELAAGGSGRVAAVWLQYHHMRRHARRHARRGPVLRYALLRRSGRVGRVVTVARLGSPVERVGLAINDHDAVAVSWVNHGRRYLGHSRVIAALCDPADLRRAGAGQLRRSDRTGRRRRDDARRRRRRDARGEQLRPGCQGPAPLRPAGRGQPRRRTVPAAGTDLPDGRQPGRRGAGADRGVHGVRFGCRPDRHARLLTARPGRDRVHRAPHPGPQRAR